MIILTITLVTISIIFTFIFCVCCCCCESNNDNVINEPIRQIRIDIRIDEDDIIHTRDNYIDDIEMCINTLDIVGKSKFNESDNCCICLDEFVNTDESEAIIKTKCNHYYHASCIYSWLYHSQECPLCLKPV